MEVKRIREVFGCDAFATDDILLCSFRGETIRTFGGSRSEFDGKEELESILLKAKTISVLLETNPITVTIGFYSKYKPRDWGISQKAYNIQYEGATKSSVEDLVIGGISIPTTIHDTSHVDFDAFRRWELIKESSQLLHERVCVGDLEIFHPDVDMPGASAAFSIVLSDGKKELFIPEDAMEWLLECVQTCDSIEFIFGETLSGDLKLEISFDIEELYK